MMGDKNKAHAPTACPKYTPTNQLPDIFFCGGVVSANLISGTRIDAVLYDLYLPTSAVIDTEQPD